MFFAAKNRLLNCKVTVLLLLTSLLLPMSGAAIHYCFDGLESPVSIHFDNFAGHETHEVGAHVDTEKRNLDDNILSKLQSQDSFLIAFDSNFKTLQCVSEILPLTFDFSPELSRYWVLNPPLRAPPA